MTLILGLSQAPNTALKPAPCTCDPPAHPAPQKSITNVPESALREALSVDVVTYGSPTAVRAWVGLAGVEAANAKVNACIGSTSARACAKEGVMRCVHYPDAPGIEGWVEAVVAGCKELNLPLPEAALKA